MIKLQKTIKGSLQDLQQMRLTKGLSSILDKLLYFCVVSLVVITCCQMAFIGKNLTYTTKFTPPESQQNSLRNQTYITEAQALIIFLCILYTFMLPVTTYSSIQLKRKAFLPILMVTLGIGAFLLVLNIYFLTGASMYRNFLNEKYEEITGSGVCLNAKTTLCMIGTCNRLRVFQQAQQMAIAFTVLDILFSIAFGLLAVLVNKKMKQSAKMELIV